MKRRCELIIEWNFPPFDYKYSEWRGKKGSQKNTTCSSTIKIKKYQ